MRKIDAEQLTLLKLIAYCDGSYCPSADLDPMAIRALHEMVKAKRLTVEQTDGGARYHLTAQGREDSR